MFKIFYQTGQFLLVKTLYIYILKTLLNFFNTIPDKLDPVWDHFGRQSVCL
jgi:hypothetical protein